MECNHTGRIGECIPYSKLSEKEKLEFVEPNVRKLVEVLNSFDGVDTIASCESHKHGDDAYVAFLCTNNESLKSILNCCPVAIEFNGGKQYIRKSMSYYNNINLNVMYGIHVNLFSIEHNWKVLDKIAEDIKSNTQQCIPL